MVPSNSVQQQGGGSVSADQINTWIQGCLTLADARNFIGVSNMLMYLEGFVAQGDGGQGVFYWSSTATGDDGGVTMIQPIGVLAGAWIRDDPAVPRCITYVVDGGGATITAPAVVGDLYLPFACTLTGCVLLANEAGNLTADIWLAPLADYPPTVTNSIATTLPALTGQAAAAQNITGWTKAFPANSTLRFQIASNSAISRLTISLAVMG